MMVPNTSKLKKGAEGENAVRMHFISVCHLLGSTWSEAGDLDAVFPLSFLLFALYSRSFCVRIYSFEF